MDIHRELDEVKAEVEKLKAECRVKTDLVESMKKAHAEQILKFQESKQLNEEQAHELNIKSEEIFELSKIREDLRSSLHEKEMHITHLTSENENIRANFAERLLRLEEEKGELVLALDKLTVRNNDLEQNLCDSNKEISGLRTILSVTEKKYLEAEKEAQESVRLRQGDDVILQLEEENRIVQDKMKWKSEQFKHLEEAHEKVQGQFQTEKAEWEKEKLTLLEEISSLQITLDSKTRILEGLQSRLEMCNQALAHEESRRKLLQAEISEFKSRFEDVFTQCEEEKSKIQTLTFQRNEEIAKLRNSLGEKETIIRDMELTIARLDEENQELGDSLKELREAQIHNPGANSLISKLRNKLRRLEEVHKNCTSTLKSKESQWDHRVEKMKGDINILKSTLTSKEQEMRELQMELEYCQYTVEEIAMELLIFKSELVEAYSKIFNSEADKLVHMRLEKDNSLKAMAEQHFMKEAELQWYKKMLEESNESRLSFKEQLLLMENTLKDERCVAIEARQSLELELAEKNNELSRLGCELQNWKSTAETLRVHYEEIKGTCQKMETSLLSHVESEQILKHEKESLLCIVKDQERKIEDLQQQITLLERYIAERVKEAETFKQEKESLVQMAEEKDCCIKELQKDIAITCLREDSTRKELEAANIARLDAEKALEQEKESLLKIKDEKVETMKYFQELAMSLEQDLRDAMCFLFSEEVEKWVEVSVLNGALKNAEHLMKLEIEEKNMRIGKSELEVNNLLEKIAYKEELFCHFKQKAEELQASFEAEKLETENLTDKQRTMESKFRELESEKETLLQDFTRLLTERESLLVYMENTCNRIGELSSEDMQLMKTLGNILNMTKDEKEVATDSVVCGKLHDSTREMATDSVVCGKLHDSTRDSANGSLPATTKKVEANVDGRSPLREVNGLHM